MRWVIMMTTTFREDKVFRGRDEEESDYKTDD